MKKIFTLITALIMSLHVMTQIPEKMSYQAVIRNTAGELITEQQVGVHISILQGSATGNQIYSETQTPTTNANGLISLEFGGIALASINWADGPFFIKTETDPSGGNNYTIIGISQLLSVPYAFHAHSADVLKGDIDEMDPVFTTWDRSSGIMISENQIYDMGDYLINETDPLFNAWDKSTGIEINESQIIDLQDYLTEEVDPFFQASPVASIVAEDISNWNETYSWGDHAYQGYLTEYSVTEEDVTLHQGALQITEEQIIDLQGYLIEETDPFFSSNFEFSGASIGDLLQFDGEKWVKFTPNFLTEYLETQTLEEVLSINNSANAQIKNLEEPTDAQDAVTKAYVDVLLDIIVGLQSDIQELQLVVGNNLPSVTTSIVTEITSNSAKSGGNILSSGDSEIIARGILWSVSENLSLTNYDGKTNEGNGIGEFVSHLTNLAPSTKYFVRAYATNYFGTAYGEKIEFNTSNDSQSFAAFIATWKTDNDGESNNNQIKLPLTVNGEYDFIIDWGDGNQSHINSFDQNEVTHTYASPGTYTTQISGLIVGWRFNNSGDRLKILNISQWGSLKLGVDDGYFLGCDNLKITTTETIDLDGLNIKQLFDAGIMVGTLEQSGALIDELINEDLIGFVEDAQGVSYKWVRIGNQYWFAENLKSTVYSDGTSIPSGWNVSYELLNNSDEPEYWFVAELSEDNFYNYGRLYTGWVAYRDDKDLCPAGWHVSTAVDWQTLDSYIISKEFGTATTYHIRDNADGVWNATDHHEFTNASGFTARPGGQRLEGSFNNVGTHAYFWVHPPGGSTHGSLVPLSTAANAIQVFNWQQFTEKHFSMSVRCVKD